MQQGKVTMDELDWLAEQFQTHRAHLQAVAYRMLGSLSEADDAVQESWLRLSRSDTSEVENLRGWLTTVVARVCLDMLRSRKSRREEPLEGGVSEAIVNTKDGTDPEHEAILAESVGLALLVVLNTLAPAERLAFVLHDMFALPFDEIAPIVGRSPVAAKKLASRARRRIQGATKIPSADLSRQRQVVDAFLAASRSGDINAILAVLDPNVVRRADRAAVPAGAATEVRGARAVAEETLTNSQRARFAHPALVNGAPGIVVGARGQMDLALSLTIKDGKITEIDVIADPARLHQLELAVLDGG
jgi:RNA polymerase sigma factor (sigma-70 family)